MLNQVDPNLKSYIEENIMPEYSLNDDGHNQNHIKRVLTRAFELAENYDIDINVLYCVVCFHDIACHIDRKMHEILSAERLFEDKNLRKFFNQNQMQMMKEAVEDHRASLEYEPRNIYGKILSSADRKIDICDYLKTSMLFHKKQFPNSTTDEMINHSYEFAIKKFGKNGYAVQKSYIEDKKYQRFLNEIQRLIDNKPEFIKKAEEVLKEIN